MSIHFTRCIETIKRESERVCVYEKERSIFRVRFILLEIFKIEIIQARFIIIVSNKQ